MIGDFRAPDVIRFGLTPLYLGFEDIWQAVDRLAAILASETWREPKYRGARQGDLRGAFALTAPRSTIEPPSPPRPEAGGSRPSMSRRRLIYEGKAKILYEGPSRAR